MKRLIVFLLIIAFPKKIIGQNPVSDTLKNIKVYKTIVPKMEFDSARIAPNADYALVLKGNYLNRCDINYWALYKKGINKPVCNYIVLLKGYAYFLTYEKEHSIDTLTYFQNDRKYQWEVTKKCRIKDLIKEYNLTLKPGNKTKNLKISFDTLPSKKVKIPYELNQKSIGDSLERISERLEIKFYYKDKLVHSTQLSFLSDPGCVKASECDFKTYYNEIRKQVRQSIYRNDYGMLFLETDNALFFSFKVETTIFAGWNYYKYENLEYINSTSKSDPEAEIYLLGKIYP